MRQMHGAALWVNLTILLVCLLLSALDTSIIATALVSIAANFGDYSRSSWVVVSYLLTYTGFLTISARLSDIFGRKLVFLISLTIFTIWSVACGVAQSLTQLIIFRALQGIGGSGVYSLVMTTFPEIVPPEQFGIASGAVGSVFVFSSILGPILGGAITTHTTWRWIYFLNVPAGALLGAIFIFSMPNDLPKSRKGLKRTSKIDFPGTALMLIASILITFAVEEGGVAYKWNSATIIVTFALSGVAWIVFGMWETWLTRHGDGKRLKMSPLFPVRLVQHRVIGFTLLSAFLTGYPFTSVIIYLPQRFQIENALSPVEAGIHTLPLLIVSAFFSAISGMVCSKKNIAWHLLLLGTALQIVGLGLMSSLQPAPAVVPAQYGYQAIAGAGFGIAMPTLIILTRTEAPARDQAVTMGAVLQARYFGGVIGVAMGALVIRNRLLAMLGQVAAPALIARLLQAPTVIETLGPAQAERVREVYSDAFNQQSRIDLYVACAAFVVTLGAFRWRFNDVRQRAKEIVEELDRIEKEEDERDGEARGGVEVEEEEEKDEAGRERGPGSEAPEDFQKAPHARGHAVGREVEV